MKHLISLIIVTIFLLLQAYAQTPGIDYMQITREEGLSGESVNEIAICDNGFAWIATSGGLDMLSGVATTPVCLPLSDKSNRQVYDIDQSSDGHIFVTLNEGVFALKPGEFEFQLIRKENGKSNLCVAGNTLLIGDAQGLHAYDGRRCRDIRLPRSHSGFDKTIHDIYAESADKLWLVTSRDLYSYDTKHQKISNYNLSTLSPADIDLSYVAVRKSKVFLGSKNHGLFIYDLKKNTIRRVSGIGNVISNLSDTHDGKLCIATDGNGAFLYDPWREQVIRHLCTTAPLADRIPIDAVYCYKQDRQGNDWLGLARNGLLRKPSVSSLFTLFPPLATLTDGIIDVRSCLMRGNETLLGTYHGFYYINKERNISYHVGEEEIGGNIVTSLAFFAGKYYIGTYDGGLSVFDPATLRASHFQGSPSPGRGAAIGALTVDPDGKNLWIGSSDGIYVVRQNGTIQHFDSRQSALPACYVKSMVIDATGNVWIGTSQGLLIFDRNGRGFSTVNEPKGFYQGEKNLQCCLGFDGNIYMANKNGIYLCTPTLDRYWHRQLPSNILNEVCLAIADDPDGHLWLATENGIFRTDHKLHTWMHFSYGEGLGNSLVRNVGYADGNIWVATADGLYTARLEDINQWAENNSHHALVYDIAKGGDRLSPIVQYLINTKSKIRLKWNFVSESLRMKACLDDDANPKGRYFEYRIGDGKWTIISNNKDFSPGRLLPGSHRLCVRLAGCPATEHSYQIEVFPSLLFILEILGLFIAAGLVIALRHAHKDIKAVSQERAEMETALAETVNQQESEEAEKYHYTKPISNEEYKDIVKRMNDYLETEHAYRNPDLKRADIADKLHITQAKLSQVFTIYLKENFYEYVNKYRLEEFKSLIDQGEYKRYTIIALSERCGFKKTAFFTTFRRVEGMTPMEYLKKKNINTKF